MTTPTAVDLTPAEPRSPTPTPAAYVCPGTVWHRRLRPRKHDLTYRVFSLLLDVDRIDAAVAQSALFSRSKPGVVSFHDRDHGTGGQQTVADHARQLLADGGLAKDGQGIWLLCYPRLFGYVFNPLSVYFVIEKSGELSALIYEVNNTFGERTSYVLAAGSPHQGEAGVLNGEAGVLNGGAGIASAGAGVATPATMADAPAPSPNAPPPTSARQPTRYYRQSCPKTMFVSPFASGQGEYNFKIAHPFDRVFVGVDFADADGALLATHFRGEAVPLSSASLAAAFWRMPLMTWKVMVAIHVEAFKLWWKGVPLVKGHTSPRFSVSYADPTEKAHSST